MIIRKLFKFEGSHVVRGCTSRRCSRNIHGHSYKVELLFTAQGLDNGAMLMDFGLMKTQIKDFIDSFDHTHVIYDDGDITEIDYITTHTERWAILPISPSAEGFSLCIFYVIDKILQNTEFINGEKQVELYSVIVHETETGYAQCFREDLSMFNLVSNSLKNIHFSFQIKSEWKDPDMYTKLLENKKFVNPEII